MLRFIFVYCSIWSVIINKEKHSELTLFCLDQKIQTTLKRVNYFDFNKIIISFDKVHQ